VALGNPIGEGTLSAMSLQNQSIECGWQRGFAKLGAPKSRTLRPLLGLLSLLLFGNGMAVDVVSQKLPMLAVMPLAGQGIDSVSAMIVTDALTDEFMRSSSVRVMERSQMEKILKEQGFQQSGLCEVSECAVQIGRLLAIDKMVVGSVGKLGDSYILTARLVDVGSGELLGSSRMQQNGVIDKVTLDLVPKVARDLVGAVEARRSSAPSTSNPVHQEVADTRGREEYAGEGVVRKVRDWVTSTEFFVGTGFAYGTSDSKARMGGSSVSILGTEFVHSAGVIEKRIGATVRYRPVAWQEPYWSYQAQYDVKEYALGLGALLAWRVLPRLAFRGGVDLEVPVWGGIDQSPMGESHEIIHPFSGGSPGFWAFPSVVVGTELRLTQAISLTIDGSYGQWFGYGVEFNQLTARLGYRI